MFNNALAIASLISYTHAQSASVTDYAAATPSLTTSDKLRIATTSVTLEVSEIIFEDKSTTLINQTMTFKLGADAWADTPTE